jgi:DNA invertase Pin-like site-specific DNA recombinase
LSAFHGDHRTKVALGLFIDKVNNGEITPGSHLVIESLDRLTRQNITESINLLTSLVLKDIVICTAADGMVYRKDHYEINQLV